MDVLFNSLESNSNKLEKNETNSNINYGNMKPKKESDDEEANQNEIFQPKSRNYTTNKVHKPFYNGTAASNESNAKHKRYSKNNMKKNPPLNASSSFRQTQQTESTPSSAISTINDPLALGSNSVQCLRESNVPLIQYKNYQNSNGIKNARKLMKN